MTYDLIPGWMVKESSYNAKSGVAGNDTYTLEFVRSFTPSAYVTKIGQGPHAL